MTDDEKLYYVIKSKQREPKYQQPAQMLPPTKDTESLEQVVEKEKKGSNLLSKFTLGLGIITTTVSIGWNMWYYDLLFGLGDISEGLGELNNILSPISGAALIILSRYLKK